MSILHTVNKSPFDRNSLESCVRLAAKGGAVLMIEDGVYGAMKGTTASDMVTNAMKDLTFYVLGPDLKARGVDEGKLIDGVKVVDYNGFVTLTVENDKVQSWL
ncbi:MAG: sulfurtransferase complex subunit TusB [Gammaproteobacteria bacterium]|nr:sulfurtransferase complex subunit TusB [Gammaproteobacteria bacterium]MDH5652342.1 sulfurtransferase complex subunit TusB [Gammaproteobacteria bacterium]